MKVAENVRKTKYGTVVPEIQDGKVVQIEMAESSGCADADRSHGPVELLSAGDDPRRSCPWSELLQTRRSTSGRPSPRRRRVVRGHRGESSCLLGPSGGGKTTILNILAGLTCRPRERPPGRETVTGPGADGAVPFQEPAFFPWLSVVANAEFALRLVDVARRARRTGDVVAGERPPDAQRQPSAARALGWHASARGAGTRPGVDPDVLLGDEPFGALDAQARELLQNEVQRVWVESEGRKTFVFVTHNVREAALLAIACW